MHYHYLEPGVDSAGYLIEVIRTHLESGERVVWLTGGGSAISTAVAVAKGLQGVDCSLLSVSLDDERYGPIGHPDENWQQLLDLGFAIEGADLYRPLQGLDRDTTSQQFGQWLEAHISSADYSIGLFGVGADGHTAGIKPHSPAITALGWAVGYTNEDFERITMTFEAIKHLDEVVVQMKGRDKDPVVRQLFHETLPLEDQPAQVLKSVGKSTLFTDYKEDTL